mgnify:CR=1 FL=1
MSHGIRKQGTPLFYSWRFCLDRVPLFFQQPWRTQKNPAEAGLVKGVAVIRPQPNTSYPLLCFVFLRMVQTLFG